MPVYEVVGEMRSAGAVPEIANLERRGDRVRFLAEDEDVGERLGAFFRAGVREIEIREYPDEAARAAWSDWGREAEGRAGAGPGGEDGPADRSAAFEREVLCAGAGLRPRVLAPGLAAALMAISLERMGALHGAAAALLFLFLFFFVVANEVRKSRLRIRHVRYVSRGAT